MKEVDCGGVSDVPGEFGEDNGLHPENLGHGARTADRLHEVHGARDDLILLQGLRRDVQAADGNAG